MTDASAIREHMEVIGSDGQHVGTVDCVRGNRLVLTKSDPGPQMEASESGDEGRHRQLPLNLVTSIEGRRVRLGCTASEAVRQAEWGD
jgi:hypothetical protein